MTVRKTGMAEKMPYMPFGPVTLSTVTPIPSPTAVDAHPVEVVGRIREHPDGREGPSIIQPLPSGRDLRIASKEHQQGYRIFSLDGVSEAENENLEAFYLKYAEAKVDDVKLGGKCTIMMCGPTGAGKSHTMFGSGSERGVAYHALIQIMGEGLLGGAERAQEVKATVWEIYNEDIFDLLAQTSNPVGSIKGHPNRVKLEVKGKKVRNSTCINDYDPNRLLKEIHKVETRRVTKRTNCNDRSSRSHCVVTFEVPAVDGRLVLVDMAGSENIDVAGVGMDSKMQTGRINQGNGALKRVVEAIANSESYIPYRDSKLTMILQESFEDKNAKVLMILCASSDPKDLFKTLGTFEYGAKAKRIVRLPNSPARDKASGEELQKLAVLNAKGAARDACIIRMRTEKAQYEKERELKEKEVTVLRKRVEDLQSQLNVRTTESETQLLGHFRLADVECELMRRIAELEERLRQMEEEVDIQRSRAESAETYVSQLKKFCFSHVETNTCWESVKQENSGVTAMVVEGSTGSAHENVRSLRPLTLRQNKSKFLANNADYGSCSDAGPWEKREKKFASSVVSSFNGGDSSHCSKQSVIHAKEVTSTESPNPQLDSPKSENKRQAGQEPPFPKTAEKKRYTGQHAALDAVPWRPSTVQQLRKVKEEEQGAEKTGKQERQHPSSTPEDAHHIRFKNLSARISDDFPLLSTRETILPKDRTQVNSENKAETFPLKDERLSMSMRDDDNLPENVSHPPEKDRIGFRTCSESKFHWKGWLPIIIEEKEEELERLGRRSMEEAAAATANRNSASCPRVRGSSSQKSSISSVLGDLSQQTVFSTSLLRDRFSPGLISIGSSTPSGVPKGPGFHLVSQEHETRLVNDGLHADLPLKNAGSTMDSLLQPLGSAFSEAEPIGAEECRSSSPVRDDPPAPLNGEAASARKTRIENIFLLCGHRREIATRTGADSPTSTRRSPSPRVGGLLHPFLSFTDPTSPFATTGAIPSCIPSTSYGDRDNQIYPSLEPDSRSPLRAFGTENRLRSPFSGEPIASPILAALPSLQKSNFSASHRKFRTGNLFPIEDPDLMLLENSSTAPSRTANAADSPPSSLKRSLSSAAHPIESGGLGELPPCDHVGHCDVHVKWESKESTSRKPVCILNISKSTSLAELRRAIVPHVPVFKQNFLFVEGRKRSGPLEPELEAHLRVWSLRDCPTNKGTRLACLRLPATTRAVYTAPTSPFRPIENTISAHGSTSDGGKGAGMRSSPKPGSYGGGKPVHT